MPNVELPGAGHNLPPIDPEKLVDAESLPAILEANYGPLIRRSAEIEAACDRWMQMFLAPRPADWPEGKSWPEMHDLSDDQENTKTADFLRQIAAFAGGRTPSSGEVYDARRAVTDPLQRASKVASAWFDALRDRIREAAGKMDDAQTRYLLRKAKEAQREHERIAEVARVEAGVALKAAREAHGADDETAAAIQAAEAAERAERSAAAPMTDLVRTTSAGGTTTTLRTVWKFRVTDIAALVKAAAEGKVAAEFLTVNEPMILASIRGGRRECPGLEIYSESSASRSGRG